jgi:hypothetical protein
MATVLVGGTVAIGNPDIRVAAEGELQPCVAGSFFLPCVAEGDVIVRVALQPGRAIDLALGAPAASARPENAAAQ